MTSDKRDALTTMLTRAGAVMKAIEADGEPAPMPATLFIDDPAALAKLLTPKRLELIRALAATPAESGRALARRLGRDTKRVAEDVTTLVNAGVIDRAGDGVLSAPFERVETTLFTRGAA